jgi:hypothetical protein
MELTLLTFLFSALEMRIFLPLDFRLVVFALKLMIPLKGIIVRSAFLKFIIFLRYYFSALTLMALKLKWMVIHWLLCSW